ncbi:MAG: hypothetical protein QOF48_2488 [Verrucomicrobiota bacterium]
MKLSDLTLAFVVATVALATRSGSAADPRISSWFASESTRYARVRETDASAPAGLSTWTGQSLPAYAGVQEVASDGTYFYVRSQGLAGYVMGPWYLNAARTQLFPNRPLARNNIWRFPRIAAIPATKTATGLGAIGLYVNGVSLFDNRDAFVWNGTTEANGTGYWWRDAYVNEGVTFDGGGAHQEQTGNYHYHAEPPALRLQLGDNIQYNSATGLYSEDTSQLHHSPVLAWVSDGLPVYGPYGYSNPTNASSGVRRMISGFVKRDGSNGTDNLASAGRGTIPAWAQRAYNVGASQSGPPVSSAYPLGRYLEDNAFLGDLTNSGNGQRYQLAIDYDLNEWNARFCMTPEFPEGTWAYFLTIRADGVPAFPYAIGRQYFATPAATQLSSIPTNGVTTHFRGGPDSRESLNRPSVANTSVVLSWSAIEGGTYRLETTTNVSVTNWAILQTNIVASTNTSSVETTTGAADPQRYYRIARLALANYYGAPATNGGGGTVAPGGNADRGTTVTVTITLPTAPPQPPANLVPTSVSLAGSIAGTSISRPAASTVLATFNIPAGAPTGAQNVIVTFNPAPTYTMAGALTIH